MLNRAAAAAMAAAGGDRLVLLVHVRLPAAAAPAVACSPDRAAMTRKTALESRAASSHGLVPPRLYSSPLCKSWPFGPEYLGALGATSGSGPIQVAAAPYYQCDSVCQRIPAGPGDSERLIASAAAQSTATRHCNGTGLYAWRLTCGSDRVGCARIQQKC